MEHRDSHNPPWFKVVPLQMLPAERDGRGDAAIENERKLVKRFVALNNQQLEALIDPGSKDPDAREARTLFGELGSDQVILAYAFNFLDLRTRTLNKDPDKLNNLNKRIYEICSISDPQRDPNSLDLIITSSQFDIENYGRDFIEQYARRLGVTNATSITFLISTTMNPWTTDVGPPIGDFLRVVEDALRNAFYKAIQELGYASSA
jgi:hypothetical protein